MDCNTLIVNWDKKHDVLYLKIDDTKNSYGDETKEGVVILRDMCTDAITGITIFDFIKKCKDGSVENLDLPIAINFDKDVLSKGYWQ